MTIYKKPAIEKRETEQQRQTKLDKTQQEIAIKEQAIQNDANDIVQRKKEHDWIVENLPNFPQRGNLPVTECNKVMEKNLKLATATGFLGYGTRVGTDSYSQKLRAWKCGGNAYVCSFNSNHRVSGCRTLRW